MNPLTIGDLLKLLRDVQQCDGGDIPVWLQVQDAQGNVTRMPLSRMELTEGPDGHPAVFLHGQQPETAEQRPVFTMEEIAAFDLSGTRITLPITPEQVEMLHTVFELVDPQLAVKFTQEIEQRMQMQQALGTPVQGLSEQSAAQSVRTQSVRTHVEYLHITSTATLVTIGGMPCQVWKSTDAEGQVSLVYIPFLRIPIVTEAGWREGPLEAVRAIDSRNVIPSGLPRYLQGTLYQSLDIQWLLTVLNTPAEPECAPARELVHELLAHGPTRHFFELFQASFVVPGFSFASSQVRAIDADPYDLQLWDTAEIPRVPAEGKEQRIPVAVATSNALWRWYVSKDPWRLKRCIECQQYFFDATRNGKKQHCTDRCKSRHTSRDHRRRTANAYPPSLHAR